MNSTETVLCESMDKGLTFDVRIFGSQHWRFVSRTSFEVCSDIPRRTPSRVNLLGACPFQLPSLTFFNCSGEIS